MAGCSRRAAIALVVAVGLSGCGRRRERHARVAGGATVLALGDSITWGTGASPDASYPSVLASLSGWNVVNAGVPGDTSSGALARLPALLAEHRPALVLVSIGGNDFLRRLPDADTRANIGRIVEAVKASGAQAVLIGVPRPTVAAALTGSLGDHPLYAQLSEDQGLPLVSGAWGDVLGDEKLRADTIHANADGYRAFAEALYRRLVELGIGGG